MGLLSNIVASLTEMPETWMTGDLIRDFGVIHEACYNQYMQAVNIPFPGAGRPTVGVDDDRRLCQVTAKLRSGKNGRRCLRMIMKKTGEKDNEANYNCLNLFFDEFGRIQAVFQDARKRIGRNEGPKGRTSGVIKNQAFKLTGTYLVHDYGRIDHSPDPSRNRVELALMLRENDGNYLFLAASDRKNYFNWPAMSLIDAVDAVSARMRALS